MAEKCLFLKRNRQKQTRTKDVGPSASLQKSFSTTVTELEPPCHWSPRHTQQIKYTLTETLIVLKHQFWKDMTNTTEQRKQFYRENPVIWKRKRNSHHQYKAPSRVPGPGGAEGKPACSCHRQEIQEGRKSNFLMLCNTHSYSRCSQKHHFTLNMSLML